MKRREVVAGIVGSAVSTGFIDSSRARADLIPSALDPNNRAHLSLLHKKLVCSADDRPLIWWIRGQKYGSISGEIIPLWTLNVLLLQSVKHYSDGSYDVRFAEIVYKTDVETDKRLSSWRNPYNGDTYTETPLIMGPLTRRFTEDGPVSQTRLPGARISRKGMIGPAEVSGNDVWLIADTHVLVDREGEKTFRAHDLKTYLGRVSDIMNPDMKSVPATISVHIIQSWHPWMNMGDREGTLITRISGAKCFSIEGLHPRVRSLFVDGHPDIAEDYVSYLENEPRSFDR